MAENALNYRRLTVSTRCAETSDILATEEWRNRCWFFGDGDAMSYRTQGADAT